MEIIEKVLIILLAASMSAWLMGKETVTPIVRAFVIFLIIIAIEIFVIGIILRIVRILLRKVPSIKIEAKTENKQ